jgi:hypothetical protein
MTTVKNAMGDSVNIIPEWAPPASTAYPLKTTFPAKWSSAKDTNNKTCTGTVTGPVYTFTSGNPSTWKWVWTVTYNVPSGGTGYCASPGNPFVCIQTIGANLNAPLFYGSYPTLLPAQDLLGQTAGAVNWGLYTYSTNGYTRQVAIDSNDTGIVTAIENKMKLSSAAGLGAGGSTPTTTALTNVKAELQTTFNADPKYNCGRTYATILLTDGLSNSGNPNNGNWISPCGACPGVTCCDGGSSGYNCPNNYTSFAAGSSENLWKTTWSRGGVTYRIPIRTWVIGCSNNVGPCELNYTAYMGRTDANSPNGDAGFALNSGFPFPTAANAVVPLDPNLPQTNGDTTKYSLAHGNYAYFATSAAAIKDAFEKIVAALGPGDYTTSQPIVSSNTGNTGQVSLLASSEYPGWKGHLYADELSTGNALWDAGAQLEVRDPATRKIYTWNSSNALVEVTAANAGTLNTICGTCGINAAVVNYIRGVGRAWKLGAVLNSTPTIIAGPIQWKSDQVPSHVTFESTYGSRHPLVYAGSSDGMLHAFDAVDGYEVFALLTPDNLADQVTFYNNYVAKPMQNPTGEPVFVSNHIWGVANSPRVQDIYFGGGVKEYKTLLFLTQGPSSRMVAAIDVTHPYGARTGVLKPNGTTQDYPQDSNYDPSAPVSIVWTKNQTSYPDLQYTWSIPAVAPTAISQTAPDFEANLGAGWNPSSIKTAQVVPKLYAWDATDGSANTTATLANLASPAPIVGNQAFADTVMFLTTARIFQEGTPQNVAIQADLNGQIWFLPRPSGTSASVVFNASTHATQAQPIYYSPAVAGFKSKMCLAFASGSYFEKTSSVNTPCSTAGVSSIPFRPRLYLIGKGQNTNAATAAEVRSWQITTLDNTAGGTLSDCATVVASPLLLVPNNDSGEAIALFAVYDPASGDCAGTSYVIKIVFDPTTLASAAVTVSLIGSGAISGFAVAGNVIVVAKSGIGAGTRATAPVVPNVTVGGSSNGMQPIWWRELQ